MQGANGGRWMYQCIYCLRTFDSSQGIAGHSKGHIADGWTKGTTHRKVFFPYPPHQTSVGSRTDSNVNVQVQAAGKDPQQASVDSNRPTNSNSQQKNVESAASPSSSTPPRKTYMRFRDLRVLARLVPRLTKEEQRIILQLIDCAVDQAKANKKSADVEVIPNKDSGVAPMIETAKKAAIITIDDDSGDESKN